MTKYHRKPHTEKIGFIFCILMKNISSFIILDTLNHADDFNHEIHLR